MRVNNQENRTVREKNCNKPWLPHTSKKDWMFKHGSLYFKNWLYIPEDTRHQLVTNIHKSLTGGHGGFFWTLHLLQKDYWWPGMLTFLRKFIAGCALCQSAKVNTLHSSGSNPPCNQIPYPILLYLHWSHHWITPIWRLWLSHGHGRPWPYKGGNLLPLY